jgi:APA family basic amino acid/polyamine antiporter
VIFAVVLFYILTILGLFRLRRTRPEAPRPYRAWGYPVVPALFVAAAAVLLYYTFTDNVRNSFIGTIVILAGVPVYWYFARQRRAD